MSGEVVLTKTQAALEAARGTALAATRKVYGEWALKKVQPLKLREEHAGMFAQIIGSSSTYLGLIEGMVEGEDDGTYEDLAWWGQLGIKSVPGVQQGGTAAYLYTFNPDQTTDTIKTATFEGADDAQGWMSHFCIADEMSISASLGECWKIKMSLLAADVVPQALTGAIGDRVRETIEAKTTKLYIGVGGADPGAQVTGTLIDWSVTIKNNVRRKYFQGEGDTMKGAGRLNREISCDFTFEETATAIAERVNWVGKTERTVKFESVGSNIVPATHDKTATIIIPGLWEGWEIGKRESNRIFTMKYRGLYNSALTYDILLKVKNALAALP